MAIDIVPSFWRMPTARSFWDDDEDMVPVQGFPGGISVSEDDSRVYVEVALPGVNPEDIEVTFDKGVLWVKGETKTEEKNTDKKYFRRAARSFSYRVAVPGDIDMSKDPEATAENGVMRIAFAKSPTAQPKKISVVSKKK